MNPKRRTSFRLWVFGLTWLLLPAIALADSRLACEQFQLEAYRQQYPNGDVCWEKEKGMRGATEYCCNIAFGGSATACRRDEARININWVFENPGARATYSRGRRGGQTPFQACIFAQGHNPRAAESIRQCPGYSIFYCNQKDQELRGNSTAPVGCEAAEKAVLWVLFLDDRARLVYDIAIEKNGMSQFDALIQALGHDPPAQQEVRICKPWVVRFLAENDWKP
jgi:hypothetical protein